MKHEQVAVIQQGSSDRPWMQLGVELMGTEEIAGPESNPAILAMFGEVGWDPEERGDDEHWCGAFVGACLRRAGLPIAPLAVRAASWEQYGVACEPRAGAVVVVGRKGGKHVAFVWAVTPSHLYLLGGNQGNAVSIKAWSRSSLVACRWPGELPPALTAKDLPGSRIVQGGQTVSTVGKIGMVGAAGAAAVEQSPKAVTQTVSEWTGMGTAVKQAVDLVAAHWIVPAAMLAAALIIFGGKIVRARVEDAEKGKTL